MGRLLEIRTKHKAQKPVRYCQGYEFHFQGWAPETMLEIGLGKGRSAKMWQEYFPGVTYYGLDRDPEAGAQVPMAKRFTGNSGDRKFLRQVAEEMGPVDLIVDDGGHRMLEQRAALEELFPSVTDGGWYVLEDMHTSYWPGYKGGLRRRGTMMQYLKDVVDSVNSRWYLVDDRAGDANQAGKRNEFEAYLDEYLRYISFQCSICFMQKGTDL